MSQAADARVWSPLAVALGVGFQVRQAGENIELAVHLRERLQVRRQLEAVADRGGLPLVPDDAVRDVDQAQARRSASACAESAGIIESSIGSASAAPRPFRNRPPRPSTSW